MCCQLLNCPSDNILQAISKNRILNAIENDNFFYLQTFKMRKILTRLFSWTQVWRNRKFPQKMLNTVANRRWFFVNFMTVWWKKVLQIEPIFVSKKTRKPKKGSDPTFFRIHPLNSRPRSLFFFRSDFRAWFSFGTVLSYLACLAFPCAQLLCSYCCL